MLVRSVEIEQDTGQLAELGSRLTSLASAEVDLGRHDEAMRLYARALAHQRDIGDRSGAGVTRGNIAGLHAIMGAPRKGLREVRAAIAIHRELDEKVYEAFALHTLADLCITLGRLEEGRSAVLRGRLLVKEIRNPRLVKGFARMSRGLARRARSAGHGHHDRS